MNACKRFFALILSLCMVLSFVPVSAFAAETDGAAVTSSEQPPENQDIFVLGSDNTQGEVKVDHAEGVARVISEPNDNVDGLTSDEYVAYDIALYTDDAGTQPYEGDATISVSIPLTSELADAQQLRGFAVSEDGEMTYIDSVTVDPVLNTATFEVSPSATVGVTEAEVDADATSISLFVGDTYESTLPGVVLDSGNQTDATAAITWGGVPILEGVLKNADNDGQKVTMAQCEYFIEVTGKTGNNVDGNAVTLNADNQSRFIDPNSKGHWTDVCNLQFQFNDDGSVYIFKHGNNKYLYVSREDLHWDQTTNVNTTGVDNSKFFIYAPVSDPSESSSELPGYKKVTEAADLVTGKYLIAFEDNDQNLYVMNAIVQGSESYKQMALVQISSNDSKITIRGLAEGNTTVDIGDRTYSVEVTQKVVDVDLFVGQSKTIPNVSGNYAAVDPQNPSIASVSTDVQLASSTPSGLSFVTSTFESGRKYVIVNYKSRQMVSNQTGTSTDKLAYNGLPGILANDPEYNFWTITATSDGKYTVQDKNDGYLTFTDNTSRVSDTEVKLTLRYSDTTGYWYVVNENSGYIYLNNRSSQPGGWATTGADNDNGNKHLLAEVVYDNTYTTDITFEGLTVGETSVMIGHTRYDITVTEESKDVTLFPGETKEYTDNSGNHANNVDKAAGFDSVAKLEVSGDDGNSVATLSAAVTSLESGKQYVIYNNRAQGVLNNTTHTASAWGVTFTGLHLNGAADANTTEIWTIEGADGVYTIKDENGQYLSSITSRESSLGDAAQINLAYNTAGYWTISQNGYYLGDESEQGTVAGGWNGNGASTDAGSKWTIYEYIPAKSASTTVTITGVAEGETSVRVGSTRYNITVKLNEIDVELDPGQVKTFTESDVNYELTYTGEGLNEGVATVDVQDARRPSDAVTVLESGKQYVIVNTRANSVMTNVPVSSATLGEANADSGLTLSGSKDNIVDAAIWTIEGSNGTYTVKDIDGKYLYTSNRNAGVSETAANLTFTYTNGYWTISQNGAYLNDSGDQKGCAAGWNGDGASTDGGSRWMIYEVIPVSTTVTITGVAKGETSVVVGNTLYNITVTGGEVVDVDLKVGETKDFVIDGVAYTTSDATYPNSSIATLDRVEAVIPKELRQITSLDQIVSGKSYLISNLSADGGSGAKEDQMLTATPLTSTTLTLSGTASVDGTANLWTFTVNNDGTYQIHQGNKYLNVVNDSVTTSATPQNLTVAYSTTAATDSAASKTGWSIGYQDGNTTYYLNNYDQLGTKAGEWNQLDNGSLWNIYEIADLTGEQYTTVTFTGVAPGTTTAQVGRVTYNIKVSKDIKDITVHIGETVVVSQDGVTSNGSNAGLDSAAIADVSWTAMPVGLDVGKLLNADGSVAGTRTLESLEYTFTLNDDGTYCIVDSTGTRYLNVRGIPQSSENVGAILIMNADGSVNIMGMDTQRNRKYLCIYRSGTYVMQWSSGKTAVSEDPEGCKFYIYEKVTDPAESSVEIKGYKRITNLDDIQNGEGYLVAFQAEGANYFCVAYVNDSVGGKYNNTARIAEPGYADVTIAGVTVGTTQVNVDGAIFNITVIPNEEEFSLDVGEEAVYEPAVAVTDEEIEAFNNAHGQIVTVEKTDDGMLKFTGVAVGLVSKARLGGTDYTILVNDENVDVLSGMGQAQNNVVTQLLLTEQVEYDLNVPAGYTAEWTSGDESVLTVDENGVIHALKAGITTVTVAIKDADGNLVDIKEIPVTVCTGAGSDGRLVNIYNAKTVGAEPYVYMSCAHSSGSCNVLYPLENETRIYFPEGMHMYGWWHERDDKEILIFTAKPEDGYALTGMGASNTLAQYMPVRNDAGDSYLTHTGCTYYEDGNCGAANGGSENAIHDWLMNQAYRTGIMTIEEVHMVVSHMVRDGMDGAHLTSRSANSDAAKADYNSTLTFIADKLPEVDKVVQGVQDATLIKEGGWTEYQDGNYAKVGEYIFYQITVTQEVPQVWQADNANLGALVYTNAMLYDQLPDAYFYTKDLDNLDGKWDAAIPDAYITSEQSVLDQLNSEWTAEQKAAGSRAFTFNVAYKIKDEDANQDIVNKVALSTTYHSSYSSGNISSSGSAEASLKVVGESLGDVVLDFGLPIMIPSLTMGHMAHRFDQDATNNAVNGCKYGTVTIVQTEGEDTLGLNDDRWTIRYTPHTVFTGYDVVYLMDSTGKLMNYFRVYPASTVYYEESFAEFGNAVKDQHGWTSHDSAITGNAQLMFISKDGTFHTISNFGYTNKYAGETGKSNGTEAVSTKSGDTATFEFTGTGFDIYANCDTATSVMAVLVYKVDGDEQLTKFYQVVTANKGEDGVVEVPDAADGLPLVSVTDLEHGHYKVVIRHTKPLNDSTAQIRLDGYRVYNTMLDGDQFYPVDEQNVTFTELRDEALTSVTGFTPDTTVDQIYSESSNTTVAYLSADEAAGLLEYGPKNEIWMTSENALAFTLKADVAYAHIGLKAPSGATSVTITTQIGDVTNEATYDITTATDMFYDIPAVTVGDVSSISGATVTLRVNSGMLSVTKLKTAPAANSTSEANVSPLNVMSETQLASVLDVIFDRKPTPIKSNVTRIYGDNRFETAFKVADELKTVLGVEKFENIIVASGTSFADALSGSYLATVKNAPILLSYDDTYDQMVRDYIAENLAENGTVYILGGEAAVAASMDDALISSGVSVKRLAGANRFDTNLAILAEAGVKNEEILVCTGTNFADSLSASATGKPILLVYNESGKLTDAQTKYLAQLNGCTFTVIGGEKAVSADLENAVAAYGTTKRIAGENRFQTSVAIAETYMSNPESVVLAYAGNYPDGLCGGVLAHAMQAPLVLTMTGYESDACAYVNAVKAKTGVILGGSGLISDNSIVNIFNLTDALEIIVK